MGYRSRILWPSAPGRFDNKLFTDFLALLQAISFGEEELIPRRVVSLLWYIPLFMEWQKERVEGAIGLKDYRNKKTLIENELERILGVP